MGDTDLVCSPLGFGTWEMGHRYGDIDDDAAADAMHKAIDAGINLIDTAEVYGPFLSEELVGQTLGERRKEIILVTKVGFAYDAENNTSGRNSKRDYIIERTEGCLKRLQTDWIDLLLIHWPDHNTPLDETMEGLEAIHASGKIRYYGVSNFTVEMMQECEQYGHLGANQVGYNLFDRRMESEVLPFCLENKIGFMAYGSLCYGLLTGAMSPDTSFVETDWRSKGRAFGLPLFEGEDFARELEAVERIKEIASRYDKSVAQLAIAWVLGHPAISVALVGMRNQWELNENLKAVDWKLGPEDRAEIDLIFQEEGVPTYVGAAQAV